MYYLIALFLALFPFSLKAAELYFSPHSGQTMEVRIKSEERVNAFEITLFYPAEKFEFAGFKEKKSIINLWIQKPKEIQKGKISFTGGRIGGFKGEGLLAELVFKPKKPGKISLVFSPDSLVLLHDGFGTPARLDI